MEKDPLQRIDECLERYDWKGAKDLLLEAMIEGVQSEAMFFHLSLCDSQLELNEAKAIESACSTIHAQLHLLQCLLRSKMYPQCEQAASKFLSNCGVPVDALRLRMLRFEASIKSENARRATEDLRFLIAEMHSNPNVRLLVARAFALLCENNRQSVACIIDDMLQDPPPEEYLCDLLRCKKQQIATLQAARMILRRNAV